MTRGSFPRAATGSCVSIMIDPEEDADRERGQDPPRHAALSGERAGETAQLLAGADVVGHLVDHLGGVAACVALQEGDERDLLEVAALHARARRSRARPRAERRGCSSETTRASSVFVTAPAALSATTARAPRRLWPARSDWASTSRLSESWSPNSRRLRSTFDVDEHPEEDRAREREQEEDRRVSDHGQDQADEQRDHDRRGRRARAAISRCPRGRRRRRTPRMSRLRWNELSASARAARISSRRMPVSSSSSKSTNDDIRLRKLRPPEREELRDRVGRGAAGSRTTSRITDERRLDDLVERRLVERPRHAGERRARVADRRGWGEAGDGDLDVDLRLR